MLCDVVRRRRRWAHAPVIHAASHFDQKKRVAWVPISMHTCGSFFYNYGAPLGGPSGRRSSATKIIRTKKKKQKMASYFGHGIPKKLLCHVKTETNEANS